VAGLLPIFIEAVPVIRAPTLSAPKESADGVVFVVDDDVSMREALSSLIRSVGLRVETFGSAHEFLRRRRSHVTACLVLDVGLPGSMSGLDLQ
jgi:FixJ family two-component response regulator